MSNKRKPPVNDDLYKEVAQEFGLSTKLVKDIVLSQSRLTSEIISSGTFDSVRWPYIGVFKAKKKIMVMSNYNKGLPPSQRKFFKDLRVARAIIKKKQQQNKKKK